MIGSVVIYLLNLSSSSMIIVFSAKILLSWILQGFCVHIFVMPNLNNLIAYLIVRVTPLPYHVRYKLVF